MSVLQCGLTAFDEWANQVKGKKADKVYKTS